MKTKIATTKLIAYLNSEIKRSEADRCKYGDSDARAISYMNYIDGYMSACYEIIRYVNDGD